MSAKGKPVLKKSYSVLQDDFFQYMRDAGYEDVERGERGSSEEHLTVTQFKVQQEQARLESIEDKIDRRRQTLKKYNEKIGEQKGAAASFHEIDSIGKKTISGNISMTPQDAQFLKELAKEGIASRGLIGDLKNKVETLKRDVSVWKRKYEKLQEQTNKHRQVRRRRWNLPSMGLREVSPTSRSRKSASVRYFLFWVEPGHGDIACKRTSILIFK